MNQSEINEILRLHKLWLRNQKGEGFVGIYDSLAIGSDSNPEITTNGNSIMAEWKER